MLVIAECKLQSMQRESSSPTIVHRARHATVLPAGLIRGVNLFTYDEVLLAANSTFEDVAMRGLNVWRGSIPEKEEKEEKNRSPPARSDSSIKID